MTPERYARVKEVFLEACDRAPEDRGAYLDGACGADAALRAAVDAMLRADGSADGRFDSGGARVQIERALDEAGGSEEATPELIGGYRVARLLGTGGMGAVYEAEQQFPRRKVAIKVLRTVGRDGAARLRQEAQILGRLQHPGIAQVIEAGTAPMEAAAGRAHVPFVAMELVDGSPLDRHAADHRLTVRERLELVARVCDAVHHAHTKGVIHRDLKPGNILVVPGIPDRVGQPKILDFGVARATREDDLESVQTGAGHVLGTLAYMSPEQVAGRPEDVDARTDIYSLGVILYELLGGRVPVDPSGTSLGETIRAIREVDPERLGRVRPELRGDIEIIAATALAKEPQRRYASAAALADDLRRFLRSEPIAARPASALYQLGRFATRNKPLVAGAAVAVLSLAIGLVVAVRQAVLLDRALRSERIEATKFRAVVSFLQDMLESGDPGHGHGAGEITVREMLDRTAAGLDEGSLADQPEVDVAVRMTLGNTYRALARYDEARHHLEEAVALGRRAYPGGHEDLAWALNKLARVCEDRAEYDRAESLFREMLEMRRRLLGENHLDTATAYNNLGVHLLRRGRYDDSWEFSIRALRIRRAVLGDEHSEVATSLNNLGLLAISRADFQRAESLLRESLAVDRNARGHDHPNIAITMSNLALALSKGGKLDEAEAMQRDAIEMMSALMGPEHPRIASFTTRLGATLHAQSRLDEAHATLNGALALARRVHAPGHPAIADALDALAEVLADRDARPEAEELLRESLAIRETTEGPEHPSTTHTRDLLDAMGAIVIPRAG